MRATLFSVGLIAWLTSVVSATALTYKLNAHEKACFYAHAEKPNLKIAFYFAVSRPAPSTGQSVRSWTLTIFLKFRYNPVAHSISTMK